MKRGFLFGLGCFFIAGVIAGLSQFVNGRDVISVVVALILLPIGVLVLRAAANAPPHRSKVYAVLGWLLGFFAIDAVILAVIVVVLVSR